MKKLIYFVSALILFGLTSCSNDLEPEYTTMPVVSNLSLTPHVAKLNDADTEEIATVYAGQGVTVSCNFSNTYGWSQIYCYYRTLTVEEYAGKDESDIERLWYEKFSPDNADDNDLGYSKVFETAPVSNQYFSYTIPGQAAGTIVRWDFGYANQYGLGAGYLLYGQMPRLEYKVVEISAANPESPDFPEEEDAE